MAQEIGTARTKVGEVADFCGLIFLGVAGVRGRSGNDEIVDDVAVARIVDGDGSIGFVREIEDVFVAGVVDEPEVRDGVRFQAPATVSINHIVEDESRRCVGRTVVVSAIAEIEDDAVAVGVLLTLVDFACDEVVRDDVVKAGMAVEPLIGVEGDAAGPAIPLRDFGGGRHVAVVNDDVVVGGEVVAIDGPDAGAAGVDDRVFDEAQVVAAAAEEAIAGVAVAVEMEAAKFQIGWAGRELA